MILSAFAAALLLTLSACGGGGTASKSARPGTMTSETTATQHTAPSQAPGLHTKNTATSTTTATVEATGLSAAKCRRLATLAAKMGQAFTSRTPASNTRAYAAALQQLAKSAPTEIRDDFGVLADAYTKVADAVAAVYTGRKTTPTTDQLQQLTKVGKELNTITIAGAANNVNAWLQKNCAR